MIARTLYAGKVGVNLAYIYCFRVGWLGPNSTVGGGGEGEGGGWELGKDRDPTSDSA